MSRNVRHSALSDIPCPILRIVALGLLSFEYLMTPPDNDRACVAIDRALEALPCLTQRREAVREFLRDRVAYSPHEEPEHDVYLWLRDSPLSLRRTRWLEALALFERLCDVRETTR